MNAADQHQRRGRTVVTAGGAVGSSSSSSAAYAATMIHRRAMSGPIGRLTRQQQQQQQQKEGHRRPAASASGYASTAIGVLVPQPASDSMDMAAEAVVDARLFAPSPPSGKVDAGDTVGQGHASMGAAPGMRSVADKNVVPQPLPPHHHPRLMSDVADTRGGGVGDKRGRAQARPAARDTQAPASGASWTAVVTSKPAEADLDIGDDDDAVFLAKHRRKGQQQQAAAGGHHQQRTQQQPPGQQQRGAASDRGGNHIHSYDASTSSTSSTNPRLGNGSSSNAVPARQQHGGAAVITHCNGSVGRDPGGAAALAALAPNHDARHKAPAKTSSSHADRDQHPPFMAFNGTNSNNADPSVFGTGSSSAAGQGIPRGSQGKPGMPPPPPARPLPFPAPPVKRTVPGALGATGATGTQTTLTWLGPRR